ncbi:MAG: polymer-forming cytoskeletal protein [Aureispira sp.]
MFGANNNRAETLNNNRSAHNSLVTGIVIKGNVQSETDIRMDGILEGNLQSSAKVIIGKSALITGDIDCNSIIIQGKVEGNITAQSSLHIQETGKVKGNITTHKLIIEDGAVFNGASVTGQLNNKSIEQSSRRKNVEKA